LEDKTLKTFKDNAGRTWTLAVNIAAMKRVKTLLNVNLMDAVENDLIQKLATDPVLLCDVIYAICKPEADKQNITDEQFGQAMAGDAIEHATVALLEELVDFFPEAKRRVLRKVVEKFKQTEKQANETAEKYLDSPVFDKKIEGILKDITDFSGSLPESQE
jgi:hypothetical protein